MRAAIYARYSSENQRPESIEDQVSACRRLASDRGFTILDDHIYADQAESGARKDRRGLAALLAAATRLTPWPLTGLNRTVFLIQSFMPTAVAMVASANMFNLRPRTASVLFVANTVLFLALVLPVVFAVFGP